VLGSLLAGLLLPVHDDESDKAEASSDATSSRASSTPTSRLSSQPWTPNHLLPMLHALRPSASVAEIGECLQELDEISKRHVDVLEHFTVLEVSIFFSRSLYLCILKG